MNHSLHVARNTQTREALEQSGIWNQFDLASKALHIHNKKSS
jgi:hypothetical protein